MCYHDFISFIYIVTKCVFCGVSLGLAKRFLFWLKNIAYFLIREHFIQNISSTFFCSFFLFYFIRSSKWQSHIKNTWGMHKNNINLLYKGCSKNCLVSFIFIFTLFPFFFYYFLYIFFKVIPPQDKLNNNLISLVMFCLKKKVNEMLIVFEH